MEVLGLTSAAAGSSRTKERRLASASELASAATRGGINRSAVCNLLIGVARRCLHQVVNTEIRFIVTHLLAHLKDISFCKWAEVGETDSCCT